MRSQYLPVAVGAFVLTGIILLISFLVFRFEAVRFRRADTYVLYFQSTMRGLQVGSPVTIRGIKVGEVIDIGLEVNEKTNTLDVPVYIQLLQFSNGTSETSIHDFLQDAVARGLRAELYSTSMLTGNVAIGLVIKPDKKAFIPHVSDQYYTIPTIGGDDSDIDLSAAVATAEQTLQAIRNLVESNAPDIKQFFTNANSTLVDTKSLVNRFDGNIGPTMNEFNRTVRTIGQAATSVMQLANHLERHPESIITGKN